MDKKSNQKKRVFTEKDCKVENLIRYGVDTYESAKVLYKCSGRLKWDYLHSAGYLSQLSVELLLKAWLLHLYKMFPAEHDLNKLFRPLHEKRVKLSPESEKWLKGLNQYNVVRYPDSGKEPEVDINHWEKTEALFQELRKCMPKKLALMVTWATRYSSNDSDGKIMETRKKRPPNGQENS